MLSRIKESVRNLRENKLTNEMRVYLWNLGLLFASETADVLTTHTFLQAGIDQEGIKFSRFFLEHGGIPSLLLAKLAISTLSVGILEYGRNSQKQGTVVNLLNLGLRYSNLELIKTCLINLNIIR